MKEGKPQRRASRSRKNLKRAYGASAARRDFEAPALGMAEASGYTVPPEGRSGARTSRDSWEPEGSGTWALGTADRPAPLT